MQLKQYSDAISAFDAYDNALKDNGRSGLIELALAFNTAEARRRRGDTVNSSEWYRIISLYEHGAALSGAGTLEDRMNRSQAMHVPYALVGRQSDALRLLKEVSDIATQASPRDRVFSLVVYDYVPLADFIVFNQQMITAIEVKN